MKTNKDYKVNFKCYGVIVVPKGTRVSNMTACGLDPNYHFVDEFGWIDTNYPSVAAIMRFDADTYGINVPIEYIDK